MDKAAWRQQVIQALLDELQVLLASASDAAASATHEDAKPENKYDTRGLEAAYLAGAQASRAVELEARVARLHGLELRAFGPGDAVAAGAVVEVENESGQRRRVFLLPEGGGITIPTPEGALQVVTPEAPLGRALLQKRIGDEITLKKRHQAEIWSVVSVDGES